MQKYNNTNKQESSHKINSLNFNSIPITSWRISCHSFITFVSFHSRRPFFTWKTIISKIPRFSRFSILTWHAFRSCINSILYKCIDLAIVVNTSRSFPHSWLITVFVTKLTRRVLLVEQELLIFLNLSRLIDKFISKTRFNCHIWKISQHFTSIFSKIVAARALLRRLS